jgi:hypothetical protein
MHLRFPNIPLPFSGRACAARLATARRSPRPRYIQSKIALTFIVS